MKRNYKITIPEPCHEDWNKMTPDKNGRFCLTCSKTVVDFTSMLPDEIQHFFIQNENNKICGRFKKSQLDTVTIQIPSRVLYIQTKYHNMFLLALFIAMGTTLFSCQNKDGDKKKIDKVEIVADTSSTMPIVVGEMPIDESHSGQAVAPPPPPPKVDQVKFIKPEKKVKCEKINNRKNNSSKEEVIVNGEVEVGVRTNADFPGGIEQFYTFFGNKFKKPENTNNANLKIRITFAVERNGSLSYVESEPVIDKAIEKEIIRVLSLCPKWQPAESNGKKIRMQYSLPIVLQ